MNSAPVLPEHWQADAVMVMEGDFPGLRPGVEEYVEYYDYPTRHRYSYPDQELVYLFEPHLESTGAGRAYSWTATKCCYSDLIDADTGEATNMLDIQIPSRAKDLGKVPNGELWKKNLNLGVMKIRQEWDVTDEGLC